MGNKREYTINADGVLEYHKENKPQKGGGQLFLGETRSITKVKKKGEDALKIETVHTPSHPQNSRSTLLAEPEPEVYTETIRVRNGREFFTHLSIVYTRLNKRESLQQLIDA